jgi:uncharacterized protein YjiS (DUF1127 family)
MSLSLARRRAAAAARRPLLSRLWHMLSVARQRQDLRALDAHLLADIGVDREQAEAEADRPVWDVPAHWRR